MNQFNKLIDSSLDAKNLRSIYFEPSAITLHFVDGGTIVISVMENGELGVETQ